MRLSIVIPMAGLGSRFAQAGYSKPKPFIDIGGSPMIERVMTNVAYPDSRYLLIAQKQHIEVERVAVEALGRNFGATIETIEGLTEGTACTILKAHRKLDRDSPMVVANSDQLVDGGIVDFINDAVKRDLDGSILTFKDPEKNPKWSFAKIDSQGLVTRVAEKEPISEFATVGIYYFKKAKYFIDNAIDMIISNDRINSEFYTCPVYNYLIKQGGRVGIFDVPQSKMHGLGTPEDLNKYLRTAKL